MKIKVTAPSGIKGRVVLPSSKSISNRALTNSVANIRYINEYTYNDQGEILSQNQKVYDKTGACVMTINMRNSYLTRDDYGNWTSNSMTLSYWEEGSQSQQTTVLQKRVIEYWEE